MKTLVLVFTCLQIFGKDAICAIFEKFSISKGKRFTTSFDSVTTLSRIGCCTRCVSTDGCMSVNFENSSKQCQLVASPSSHLHNGTEVASGWDIYSIYDPNWLLVFRGTAGAGGNIYDAWVYGTYLVTGGDMDNCMRLDSTSCTGHYRNTVVESWSTIGITKVKFSVFKDGEEKHFIIFNGAGTNHTNWFDAARILKSSWIDLKYKSFEHFSLRGYSDFQRTFHIAHVYDGCEGDLVYLQVSVEAPGNDWPSEFPPCSYDYHTVYPTILYAENINSGGELFYSSSEVGEADFIAISISTVE